MFENEINKLNEESSNTPSFSVEKRTYTIPEIQDILGISPPTAYALVRKNLFRTVHVGRHIRISKKSFDAWLDEQNSKE